MTLLLTVFAAIIVSVLWYRDEKSQMNLAPLMFMFWGASLMWLADAIYEYIELGADYFCPTPTDMLNDSYLGLSVIALALVIWLVILFIKDPKKTVTKAILRKTSGK